MLGAHTEGGDGREAADDHAMLKELTKRYTFHSVSSLVTACCRWPQFLANSVLFYFVLL